MFDRLLLSSARGLSSAQHSGHSTSIQFFQSHSLCRYKMFVCCVCQAPCQAWDMERGTVAGLLAWSTWGSVSTRHAGMYGGQAHAHEARVGGRCTRVVGQQLWL